METALEEFYLFFPGNSGSTGGAVMESPGSGKGNLPQKIKQISWT